MTCAVFASNRAFFFSSFNVLAVGLNDRVFLLVSFLSLSVFYTYINTIKHMHNEYITKLITHNYKLQI